MLWLQHSTQLGEPGDDVRYVAGAVMRQAQLAPVLNSLSIAR